MLAGFISKDDRKAFFNNGFILKENFLDEDEFKALEKETNDFDLDFREARQGNTITQRAALSPDVIEDYPAIYGLLNKKLFKSLAAFTAGHLRPPFYYLEEVKNQYIKGAEDPQKFFHHDTFHPSMKCWLFIHDIEEKTGAFTFIPSSHKLNWKRLKWEYKMSLSAHQDKNTLHAKGSTRYSDTDLTELGLAEPIEFAVKKNTLLFVNVFGIHKRGESTQKSTRLAIWGDSRTNPFIPLPGIGGEFVNNLQYYFLDKYRNKVDALAKKEGRRSPWELVQRDKQ